LLHSDRKPGSFATRFRLDLEPKRPGLDQRELCGDEKRIRQQ
jgi:hypothetical protein